MSATMTWKAFWEEYERTHPEMANVECMNLSGESYQAGMLAMKQLLFDLMDKIGMEKVK